jgi:hypothetical protein
MEDLFSLLSTKYPDFVPDVTSESPLIILPAGIKLESITHALQNFYKFAALTIHPSGKPRLTINLLDDSQIVEFVENDPVNVYQLNSYQFAVAGDQSILLTLDFLQTWRSRRILNLSLFPDLTCTAVMLKFALQSTPFDWKKWSVLQISKFFFGFYAEFFFNDFVTTEIDENSKPEILQILNKKPNYVKQLFSKLEISRSIGVLADPIKLSGTPDSPTTPSSSNFLDQIDAIIVLSPVDPSINLAVRVTESTKKIYVQELYRASMLLQDVHEMPNWFDSILQSPEIRDTHETQFLLIQVEAVSEAIAYSVSSIVKTEQYQLITELFASSFLVRPWLEASIGIVKSLRFSQTVKNWSKYDLGDKFQHTATFCLEIAKFDNPENLSDSLSSVLENFMGKLKKSVHMEEYKNQFIVTAGLTGELPEDIKIAIHASNLSKI